MFRTSLHCLLLLLAFGASAKEIRLSPESDLKPVLKQAEPGDVIVMEDGIWKDVKLRFERLMGTEKEPIHIRAESPGKVVLTGSSQVRVSGQHVIVSGLSFLNPEDEGDVFEFRTHDERLAHHCRITECSFEQTKKGSDKKSLWVNVYGSNNRVDHCYFAGKRNKGTTLVVWVTEDPGSHRIDHNHFGPRPELGGNGGETIRIGISDTSEFNSGTIVESNYFEKCNGEGEVVSNKSCENIYRYNLFDRCEGALTLRHGHRCVVDGNVFLGHQESGTGGVRIIGSDHRVINNYFEGLRGDAERAAISLMNGIPESPLDGYAPVRKALIAHNTIIDCKVSMEFGVSASKKISVAPESCRVSHNVFLPGKWELFRVQAKPRDFTWTGNKHQSGKTRGADLVSIERVEIKLTRGSNGLLRPSEAGELKTKEKSGVVTDVDGEPRDSSIAGCDDPSTAVTNREIAKSAGPSWRQK
ncbi:polysaccharide lyase 6 family protein [bacterium]|nr:polysaccharide lyase 6 family protein [Akkermansiaceae bacterium]MDB4429736.1 polysaccharide lyase 6 family protein [Akkermansiaceae bacterium]MDB4588047.1 polysaccharide lyase 6 family protein [bacterium]